MAVEKRPLGTEENPDVMVTGNSVDVEVEPSRADQLREAVEILVTEENILVDDEINEVAFENGVLKVSF